MMETKFTPGPWEHHDYRAVKKVDNFFGNVIAWTANNAKTRTPEALANARLIAAAPEMYEALKEAEACMSIVEPRSDAKEYSRILDVVRAALSKAVQS